MCLLSISLPGSKVLRFVFVGEEGSKRLKLFSQVVEEMRSFGEGVFFWSMIEGWGQSFASKMEMKKRKNHWCVPSIEEDDHKGASSLLCIAAVFSLRS